LAVYIIVSMMHGHTNIKFGGGSRKQEWSTSFKCAERGWLWGLGQQV